MRKRAEVVVVGAGIVGSAVAHYLTRAGIRNVVVVDQGPLENTGGSSFHAPGLVFHANASRTLALLAMRSTDLYRSLHTPESPAWLEVGGIELATTPERLAECHRRQAYAAAVGVEASVLSPAEVVDRVPLVDPGAILGGLYISRDGLCKAAQRLSPAAGDAESRGAEINELTEVVGFDIRDGRVRGVETSAGSIATATVIACAGIWSKNLQAHDRRADAASADATPAGLHRSGARAGGHRGRVPSTRFCATRIARCTSASAAMPTASAPTGTSR